MPDDLTPALVAVEAELRRLLGLARRDGRDQTALRLDCAASHIEFALRVALPSDLEAAESRRRHGEAAGQHNAHLGLPRP